MIKEKINKFFYWLGKPSEFALRLAGIAVGVAALALNLPSLAIPLGLPPEGDAIDYRIPLVKWILRHGQLPNWSWTMVDDYPNLAELVMVPLYWLHPALTRLVPMGGYFLIAAAAGMIFVRTSEGVVSYSARTRFLLAATFALVLRPLALQSNLLMVDTLTSGLTMMSLAYVLQKKPNVAGAWAALALATRYSVWGSVGFLAISVWIVSKNDRFRSFLNFCLAASVGALPFMVRNFFLNEGNPFFPIGSPAASKEIVVDWFGRGTDLFSIAMFPYDLLVTNTYVKGIFDYTIGKAFYLQLLVALLCLLWARKKVFSKAFFLEWGNWKIPLLFSGAHFLIWFNTTQQLRFLVPSLLIWNLMLLQVICRYGPRLLLLLTVLAGALSIVSIQRDSILLAAGMRESIFEQGRQAMANCFHSANIGNGVVGHSGRDAALGFFDHDFTYIKPNPYSLGGKESLNVDWAYPLEGKLEGFEPWPPEAPCLWKKKK